MRGSIYTDKDYFDSKFREQDEKNNMIIARLDNMNGQVAKNTKFREEAKRTIAIMWSVITFVSILVGSILKDVVIGFFEKR